MQRMGDGCVIICALLCCNTGGKGVLIDIMSMLWLHGDGWTRTYSLTDSNQRSFYLDLCDDYKLSFQVNSSGREVVNF